MVPLELELPSEMVLHGSSIEWCMVKTAADRLPRWAKAPSGSLFIHKHRPYPVHFTKYFQAAHPSAWLFWHQHQEHNCLIPCFHLCLVVLSTFLIFSKLCGYKVVSCLLIFHFFFFLVSCEVEHLVIYSSDSQVFPFVFPVHTSHPFFNWIYLVCIESQDLLALHILAINLLLLFDIENTFSHTVINFIFRLQSIWSSPLFVM